MNATKEGRGSLQRTSMLGLTTKQMVVVIIAIAAAVILEILGLGASCLGFLLIAVILYMLPHIMGVTAVKTKAIIGVIFVVLTILVGTVGYFTINNDISESMNKDGDHVSGIEMTTSGDTYTFDMILKPETYGDEWKAELKYAKIDTVAFGLFRVVDEKTVPITVTQTGSTYNGNVSVDLPSGEIYWLRIVTTDDGERGGHSFGVDTGVSTGSMLFKCFYGAAYCTAFAAVLYFIILIFSALIRKSAGKKRDELEKEGRLYPQGYGRCKNCGAMVLPGEVNCRKCGTYIDVPDDIKPQKKDSYTCTECGAEVPANADRCPKCGAKFDETVNEVVHKDGTVDTSRETFECSECGAVVPANATRCPKCGATFDDDDD